MPALVMIRFGRRGKLGPDSAGAHRRHRHQRRRPSDHAHTPATRMVLTSGLTVDDIDLFELNEGVRVRWC